MPAAIRRTLTAVAWLGAGVVLTIASLDVRAAVGGPSPPPAGISSACQSGPLQLGWQLGGGGQLAAAVVADVDAGCVGKRYRLTISDMSRRVVTDIRGVTAQRGGAFTIPLAGVPAGSVATVALEIAG